MSHSFSSIQRPTSLLKPVTFDVQSLRDEMMGRHLVFDAQNDLNDCFVIIGVPDDRGVALNRGFTGASGGPDAFRQAFYRLYDTRLNSGEWFGGRWRDLGDIVLCDNDIRATHERLSEVVHWTLSQGARRIFVIGGGHDFSFGSYAGHVRDGAGLVPIINFDAHFDLRPVENDLINSGTPFRRVIESLADRIADGRALFEIGIQRERNPQSLWDYARAHGVAVAEYCAGEEPWRLFNVPSVKTEESTLASRFTNRSLRVQVDHWLNHWTHSSNPSTHLHLSIDLDVFHTAAAMGTSASTSFGVPVETLWPCMEDVMSRKMCRVVDVAELCPARDIQMQTARLAASVVFRGAFCLERDPR